MRKKDSQPIFSYRRTLHERNQIRKRMVAHILRANFKKEFRTCRIPVGDQFFTVDLMSEDDEIAAKIVNPCRMPCKKISSGKFQQILSAIIVLKSIDSKRKLLIFTNKRCMKNFLAALDQCQSQFAMQHLESSCHGFHYQTSLTTMGILSRNNFRNNQNSFSQTRRGQQ